jgi:hypothetical protein
MTNLKNYLYIYSLLETVQFDREGAWVTQQEVLGPNYENAKIFTAKTIFDIIKDKDKSIDKEAVYNVLKIITEKKIENDTPITITDIKNKKHLLLDRSKL